jgi:predicted enzyme related to lactoylglutathione lyase
MGCLVTGNGAKPGLGGVMVWFDVEGRLKESIAAAAANGGRVLGDVHAIGGFGYRAELQDSEGNKIALYSSQNQ